MLIHVSRPVFKHEKVIIPSHLTCVTRQVCFVFSTCVASPFGTGAHDKLDMVFENTHVNPAYSDYLRKEILKMVEGYIERKAEKA